MNKIKIEGYECDCGDNIKVIYNGIEIHNANDTEYESSDATSCVELLVSMANVSAGENGSIELKVDDYVSERWPASRKYLV